MTDDDRRDTRQGGTQGENEVGALLGGLLDGLPESGRGSGDETPANPFRTPVSGGSSRQGAEPSHPTDAPPPTGPPVSTDADPDPLGLASPTGLLASTQQTWHAGAEVGGAPDESAPPTPSRDEDRETPETGEADESAGAHHAPGPPVGPGAERCPRSRDVRRTGNRRGRLRCRCVRGRRCALGRAR